MQEKVSKPTPINFGRLIHNQDAENGENEKGGEKIEHA